MEIVNNKTTEYHDFISFKTVEYENFKKKYIKTKGVIWEERKNSIIVVPNSKEDLELKDIHFPHIPKLVESLTIRLKNKYDKLYIETLVKKTQERATMDKIKNWPNIIKLLNELGVSSCSSSSSEWIRYASKYGVGICEWTFGSGRIGSGMNYIPSSYSVPFKGTKNIKPDYYEDKTSWFFINEKGEK